MLMRVLVTGGAGFIGSHITDALLARGHDVTVIDDLSSGRWENVPAKARFVEGDIRNAATVAKLFEEQKPEVVCHQAAQTSVAVSTREPVRDAEINVIGGVQLLEQAVKHKVARFVFASTGGAIYGEVPEGRASTDTPPRPLSPYACSKFAFEGYLGAYAKEHGLNYTVLRYANVYGPRQDPHGEAGVVAIFSQRLLDGQPVQINARRENGDAGCVRDYVFVEDVVRANMLAIEGKIEQRVVNLCTGEATTTLDLAQAIARATGVTPELKNGPRRAGDVERSVLDGGAFLKTYPATPLDTGVQKTIEWFRSRPKK
jgi:UDP-glucose 4-epimerase